MTAAGAPRRPPDWLGPAIGWGAAAAGAVALGLLAKAPAFVGRGAPRIPAPAEDLGTVLFRLGVGSPGWYAAAAMAPLLAWGARRLAPERDGWPRTLAVAGLVLAVLAAATAALQYLVYYGDLELRPTVAAYLAVAAPPLLLPWAALGGLVALIEGRRRTVQATVERERLRAQLAEQRLIALTAQLQPHFLFNTLQGISTLIHRDPAAADDLLGKLGDLLREVLRHRDRVLVPLAEEIRLARTYLEITRIRFGDRLEFAIEVPESVHDRTVPIFILQPLIENAVAHGIGGSLSGGRIVVRGRSEDGRLVLEVEDTGTEPGEPAPPREGVGLSNTRERLRASYGEDFRFDLARVTAGMVARIEIPSRP